MKNKLVVSTTHVVIALCLERQLRHALSDLADAVRNLKAEFPQSLRATEFEDDVHTS